MNGKGSRPRPCNKKIYDENYERIFGKKQADKGGPSGPGGGGDGVAGPGGAVDEAKQPPRSP